MPRLRRSAVQASARMSSDRLRKARRSARRSSEQPENQAGEDRPSPGKVISVRAGGCPCCAEYGQGRDDNGRLREGEGDGSVQNSGTGFRRRDESAGHHPEAGRTCRPSSMPSIRESSKTQRSRLSCPTMRASLRWSGHAGAGFRRRLFHRSHMHPEQPSTRRFWTACGSIGRIWSCWQDFSARFRMRWLRRTETESSTSIRP